MSLRVDLLQSATPWDECRPALYAIDLELQVGSPRDFERNPAGEWSTLPDAEQITAKAIDGTIRLNAIADLSDETRYAVVTRIDRGDLEEFDKLYIHNNRPLRGSVDGWVALQGHGDDANNVKGKGQLQISPAALYDLPVIVSIFERLTFVPRMTVLASTAEKGAAVFARWVAIILGAATRLDA